MNKSLATIGGVVVLLAVLAGGGYLLMMNLDGIIKGLIEDIGTETTGTEVRVSDVKMQLTEGTGTISGLTIANPEGFSKENLFTMGSIKVAIDTDSLTQSLYVIDEIAIDGAAVLAEQIGGGTNLQALMNNMASEESAESETPEDTAEDVKLAVNEISFTNGAVTLRSDVFGEREMALPDFTLRNLGVEEGGLTPNELGEEVAAQLIGEVTDAVTDEIKDIARDAAREKLKEQIGEKASEGLNKLKGLFSRGDDDEGEG